MYITYNKYRQKFIPEQQGLLLPDVKDWPQQLVEYFCLYSYLIFLYTFLSDTSHLQILHLLLLALQTASKFGPKVSGKHWQVH